MKQFPQASMAIDQYKAYVAQMTSGGGYTRIAGKIVGEVIDTGINIGTGMVGAMNQKRLTPALNKKRRQVITSNEIASDVGEGLGLAGSMVTTAINLLADKQYYQSIPDAVLGTANSCLMMGINNKFFKVFHKSITAEYAKVIDNFFTMYGYRVNLVKTPIMNNHRKYFTYVKTSGCNVHGNLPASDARLIEEMFDRGTRFWTTEAINIGDYTTHDNIIVS